MDLSYLYGISLGLTSAGSGAFKPPMIGVSVAGTSAVLIPSTARSATTGSAGFRKRAALRTCHPPVRGNG